MKKTEENHSKLEDEDDDEEDLKVEQKSLPIVSNIGMCLLPDQLDPNIVARTVDLVCGKPHKPSRPRLLANQKLIQSLNLNNMFPTVQKLKHRHSRDQPGPPMRREYSEMEACISAQPIREESRLGSPPSLMKRESLKISQPKSM